MLTAYLLLYVTDQPGFQKTTNHLIQLTTNIIPLMVLVFILMYLSNLLIKSGYVKKYLGHSSGVRGWIIALTGGIISTGPIYVWYPILRDLRKEGMSDSLLTALIYARSIKIPLLPLMIAYFGAAYTMILLAYTLVFSVLNALVLQLLIPKNKIIKQ